MEDDYGYANARLRAMKSRLLTRSDYSELLDAQSVEDLVARLTHTAYQPEIEAALVKYGGWECLSEALRRHFSNSLTKITRFFGENSLRLWSILIARWQVFNIKTILRGQVHNVPASEIFDALIPVGDLKESDLQRLAQQTSPRATIDLLATWHHPLAKPLLAALQRYIESNDLAELELALDRARYASATEELKDLDDSNAETVMQVLSDEIDATNILTLVRLSQWAGSGARLTQRYGSAAPAPLLLKGGGSASHRLMNYDQTPALEQIVRDLGATPFGDALARGETRFSEKHSLSAFEDELEAQLEEQNLARFHLDPLSIDIAIAYLAALSRETRNLRLIGRAKAAGWKRDEIEKELRWQD
ncbi:MAG: V-type ATPase subunit [Chloroflexota bacterium]|nr:V-type ATPase subunit [Chloroflexota bacterium]